MAKDKNGDITTIGRSGSDFSAAIFGAALKAKEIQVWKDVPAGSLGVISNQHFSSGVSVCLSDTVSVFYSGRIVYTYANAGE